MTMQQRMAFSIAIALSSCGPALGTAGAAQMPGPAATAAPAAPTVTLTDAIRRAEANEPLFAAARAERRALALERTDARATLLPTASYHNQVLYTQPNGQSDRIGQTINAPTPIFIANNAIREYATQGVFNETLSFQQLAAIHLADANAARAAAEEEVARRGLVATVVALYYTLGAQQAREAVARRALDEATHFVEITNERESAREAAHADVLKAQLQQQQRQRDVADAQVSLDRARLELGVLLFEDPATAYTTAPPTPPPAMPERSAIEAAARRNNPELKSAFAALEVARAGVDTARAALLPQIGLNVMYGVDAPQFAVNGPDRVRNLGYAAGATLDIPVWDWLTSERRLKESHIREGAGEIALSAAQRRLLATLSESYAEATVAQAQLASLDLTAQTARESLRLTNLRYVDGEGTVLEVVDAQNTLIAAETAQADGTVRYQTALAQLQTLTGTL